MEGISLDRLALGQIGCDSKDLLDSIYSLRGLGVGTSVTFPYIVVVGDQSSGKSSILEAISGMRFPIKDGVCTRFATEISVRPGLKESVHVKIIANHRDQQSAFNGKSFSKNDLPKLIEEAKGMMKVDDDATSVSEDILRINISGPELTPLFLVDLPGFCRAEISEQPTEEVSSVLRITDKYLKRKNNIILAVVSADAEIEEQSVITEVQMNDPTGERTIGIITKPDLLIPGSIKSRKYLKLAKNLEGAHILKLGWHVLRNTDCPDRNETNPVSRRASDGSGDQKKMEFSEFRDCVTFPSSNNGVDSLRQKLSKVLKRQFQLSVPNLVEAVEATIESQQNRLNSLGKARSSASEIRQYLVTIAERLKDLTYSAVGGIYDGEFFSSLDASALNEEDAYVDQRKLRAVIRNLNGAFNNVISSRGSAMRIVGCADIQFGDGCKRPGPYHWDSGLNRFEVEGPVAVPWTNLKTRLEKMALNDLGSQFPGSSNDRLALELFREQSRPWKGIAKQYLKLAMDSARMFVELALEHVTGADENIRDAILAEYVLDYFDRKASHLNDKLEELLVHYQEGEIVCLEDEFRMRVSLRTAPGFSNDVQQITPVNSDVLARDDYTPNETTSEVSDDDAGELRLKQVLDNMITYYEMSLQTFTNNLTVLAVETCLISKMKSVFTTTAVLEMDDDTLLRLGSESQESQRERLELQNSIAALKSDLAICKKHRPRPSSMLKATAKSRMDRISPGLSEIPRVSSTPPVVSQSKATLTGTLGQGIPSRDATLRATHKAISSNPEVDAKWKASVNTIAIAKSDDKTTSTTVATRKLATACDSSSEVSSAAGSSVTTHSAPERSTSAATPKHPVSDSVANPATSGLLSSRKSGSNTCTKSAFGQPNTIKGGLFATPSFTSTAPKDSMSLTLAVPSSTSTATNSRTPSIFDNVLSTSTATNGKTTFLFGHAQNTATAPNGSTSPAFALPSSTSTVTNGRSSSNFANDLAASTVPNGKGSSLFGSAPFGSTATNSKTTSLFSQASNVTSTGNSVVSASAPTGPNKPPSSGLFDS